jgi:hypothetical protein
MGAANLAAKRAIRATRSRPLERARALLNWRLDVATNTTKPLLQWSKLRGH